jgi:NAD dependent epimerase/dehydratase family enzyme
VESTWENSLRQCESYRRGGGFHEGNVVAEFQIGVAGFIGIRPWTEAKNNDILDSRVITTKASAHIVAAASPTPKSFLVASGIGAYGDHFIDNEIDAVDESAVVSQSHGFLAEVARQWEAATSAAAAVSKKHRMVNTMFCVFMSTKCRALM